SRDAADAVRRIDDRFTGLEAKTLSEALAVLLGGCHSGNAPSMAPPCGDGRLILPGRAPAGRCTVRYETGGFRDLPGRPKRRPFDPKRRTGGAAGALKRASSFHLLQTVHLPMVNVGRKRRHLRNLSRSGAKGKSSSRIG